MQQLSLTETLSFVKTLPKFKGIEPLSFDETLSLYEKLVVLESSCKEDFLPKVLSRVNSALIEESLTQEESALVLSLVEELEEASVVRHKNHRRPNSALSRIAKRRWTRYKEKYKRALKKFWRSGKSKHFQKTLSTPAETNESTAFVTREDVLELMKAVSSGLTHFIIELHVQERDTHALLEEDITLLEEMRDLSNAILEDLTSALSMPDDQRSEVYSDCIDFAQEIFTDLPVDVTFKD